MIAQTMGTFGGGGAQRAAWNLAVALHELGEPSMAIAVRERGAFALTADNDGPLVMELGAGDSAFSRARAAWRLRRLIARHRIEHLHVHGPSTLMLTLLATMAMRHPPRLWCTWHNSEAVLPPQPHRRRALLNGMRTCAGVFASSEEIATTLREALNGATPVRVLTNGVPMRESAARSGEPPHIAWAGRLTPSKDPLLLVRALGRLRRQGLRFRATIAGDAPPRLAAFEREVHSAIADGGLADVVDLPGWVDDADALFATADIGAQTSRTEGLSMTLLEQMMRGLAIVATEVGDTSRAIEHGATGVLVRPNDETAMADALRSLITKRARRGSLGDAARRRACERFSTHAMAREALRCYRGEEADARKQVRLP